MLTLILTCSDVAVVRRTVTHIGKHPFELRLQQGGFVRRLSSHAINDVVYLLRWIECFERRRWSLFDISYFSVSHAPTVRAAALIIHRGAILEVDAEEFRHCITESVPVVSLAPLI